MFSNLLHWMDLTFDVFFHNISYRKGLSCSQVNIFNLLLYWMLFNEGRNVFLYIFAEAFMAQRVINLPSNNWTWQSYKWTWQWKINNLLLMILEIKKLGFLIEKLGFPIVMLNYERVPALGSITKVSSNHSFLSICDPVLSLLNHKACSDPVSILLHVSESVDVGMGQYLNNLDQSVYSLDFH